MLPASVDALFTFNRSRKSQSLAAATRSKVYALTRAVSSLRSCPLRPYEEEKHAARKLRRAEDLTVTVCCVWLGGRNLKPAQWMDYFEILDERQHRLLIGD